MRQGTLKDKTRSTGKGDNRQERKSTSFFAFGAVSDSEQSNGPSPTIFGARKLEPEDSEAPLATRARSHSTSSETSNRENGGLVQVSQTLDPQDKISFDKIRNQMGIFNKPTNFGSISEPLVGKNQNQFDDSYDEGYSSSNNNNKKK